MKNGYKYYFIIYKSYNIASLLNLNLRSMVT